MARKMTPDRQRSLLALIKECLESEQRFEVAEDLLYDPTELKELLRSLVQRWAGNVSDLEGLQAALERQGFKKQARAMVQKTEWLADAMQAFLYASIVLMRQKYELAAMRSRLEDAQLQLIRLREQKQRGKA